MRADGEQGVSHGLSLAEELGSKVTIITVTESFPVPSIGASEEAKAILSAAKEAAEEMGLTVETLHIPNAGSPATAIVDAAKTQGCDLIVMSSHGHRGIRRAILGSRTAEVLANSRIPVLVVHGSADRSDDGET